MTRDTLLLLRDVVTAQQIPVNHPQFAQVAQRFALAVAELDDALAATELDGPSEGPPTDR
jgi:hypothetical protein